MGKREQHCFQQNCVQEGANPPCTIAQFFAGSIDEKGQHTDQRQQDAASKKRDNRKFAGGVEQQTHEKGAEHDKSIHKNKPMQPEFDLFHTLLLIVPAAV